MNLKTGNNSTALLSLSLFALLLAFPAFVTAQNHNQAHGYTGHAPVSAQPIAANPYMSPQPVLAHRPVGHQQVSPARPQPQLTISSPIQRPAPSLISQIRLRAEQISKTGLRYIFGATSPRQGGLDCSGAMMYLLSDLGFYNIPRTSYHQCNWLEANRTLTRSQSIPAKVGENGFVPGCLIFWGGTYESQHEVTHVMLYLGQGSDGRHYMFGARGSKERGVNGSGVDIFELPSGYNQKLVGYGHLPAQA